MLRTLKFMMNLVILGFVIGRAYGAWEQRIQRDRLKQLYGAKR
jgi:hypothetical protein